MDADIKRDTPGDLVTPSNSCQFHNRFGSLKATGFSYGAPYLVLKLFAETSSIVAKKFVSTT